MHKKRWLNHSLNFVSRNKSPSLVSIVHCFKSDKKTWNLVKEQDWLQFFFLLFVFLLFLGWGFKAGKRIKRRVPSHEQGQGLAIFRPYDLPYIAFMLAAALKAPGFPVTTYPFQLIAIVWKSHFPCDTSAQSYCLVWNARVTMATALNTELSKLSVVGYSSGAKTQTKRFEKTFQPFAVNFHPLYAWLNWYAGS